ncbi:hypothetical protein F6J84_06190 [Microbacterium caowuchunii]|uniref:Uncharacterized protein n=1 Tax=Microbacterium caowuchunii TaxID=2614638 RepID=A0A5J6KYR0_9MICO|nr:LuxR C-terminal-related transcriptional regulator [Microbacterium caowuchunii]KAA9134889.1 hypothetical protein F6B40_04130 [Microbacterium caowuchunii]QEV99726.1 hypothetical protein F6J84_06190 [Microbacterium caowuchunii]
MSSAHPAEQIALLRRLSTVLDAPRSAVTRELSALLAPIAPHTALVVVTADAGGGERHGTGDAAFVDAVSALQLDHLRRIVLRPGSVGRDALPVAGVARPTLQVLARNGALLVLADPVGEPATDEFALHLWNVVASHLQKVADAAPPDYLHLARATSGVRMDALTELADEYSTTLESVLATLRSGVLDDSSARRRATVTAADGLVHLRTASDRVRTYTEEPVTTAFARLRDDLHPLVTYRDLQVQFVEPPADGRPLPGEVAHGARAVVRGAVLALVDVADVSRVRVQWDCDGTNLLINVRDDGPGDLSEANTLLQLVRQRIHALDGRMSVAATPGWGTEMAIVIPLDPPHAVSAPMTAAGLRPREREVIELLTVGRSNRAIAQELGISENTVKFHVSRILRKLGAASRAEAVSMLLSPRRP